MNTSNVVAKGEAAVTEGVRFVVHAHTENPLNGASGNSRVAAIVRTQKRKRHREQAMWATLEAMRRAGVGPQALVPCVVTLTRISSGTMDTDGLAASQKGLRDGIADALRVNDGGPFVEWRYAQAKGAPKTHAVHVKIERTER